MSRHSDSQERLSGDWSGDDRSDIGSFADRFDREWMHAAGQEPGASELDPALWDRIRREAAPSRAHRQRRVRQRSGAGISRHSRPRTADRVAAKSHDPIPVPPTAAARRGRWLGTAFALAALLLLLVGIWFSPIGPGSLFDEGEPIQYAAQVPVASPSMISSPESTPEDLSSYLPLDIPGVTCDVEPLTEDEVMDIVRNPENRSRQLFDPGAQLDDRLMEVAGGDPWQFTWSLDSPDSRQPSPEEYEPVRNAADQFWSCLRVGTAFQVWSLIDPDLVQREILWPFPVFRDEESVREYIVHFGPLRYSASIAPRFPDLNGGTGPFAERYANLDSDGAILVQDEDRPTYMYVNMVQDSDPDQPYMIVFRKFGDGNWRAVGMYFGT
ncbi:MAG TPA: hypothetical protein VNZ58_07490 [Thermomicrobiales bacterium]|nr:hypothetical protein [Thermomicrobiales bacterium]